MLKPCLFCWIDSLKQKNMKKVIILILIAWFLVLASCNSDYSTPLNTDYTTETDISFQGDINDKRYTSFRLSDGCSFSQFVETYEGYYYLKNFYVYYCSDGISKYVKLCSKPDCRHSDNNCNAYTGANLIAYYDGYMYYVAIDQYDYCLFRMNMDGTNHVKIKSISTIQERCTGFFEHGYLYYYKGTIYGLLGNTNTVIYRTAVFDKSEGTIVVDTKDNGINTDDIFLFYPHDEYIYFYTFSPDTYYSVCRYSMETSKWSDYVNTEMCFQSVLTDADKVYWYLNGDGFYEYTYETGTIERVADTVGDGLYGVSYNDEYIYAYQYYEEKYSPIPPMLYVFDRQYNLIDNVSVDIPMLNYFSPFYLTELDDYVLLSTSINDSAPDYYIKKSEFGSGNITVRKIGD